jgi:hypothetical protein
MLTLPLVSRDTVTLVPPVTLNPAPLEPSPVVATFTPPVTAEVATPTEILLAVAIS